MQVRLPPTLRNVCCLSRAHDSVSRRAIADFHSVQAERQRARAGSQVSQRRSLFLVCTFPSFHCAVPLTCCLGRCPKTIKLFQNKKNIDFSDVSKTAPSHVCNFSGSPSYVLRASLVRFLNLLATAELQNAGPEKDLFFPLVFSKFTNTRFLTVRLLASLLFVEICASSHALAQLFVESNFGKPTSVINRIALVGRCA